MILSVFLSHSWQDKRFARRLASDLSSRGVYVWIDEAEIQVGDSLIEKIRKGIDVVDYLVVVLSPDSVKSEWVKKEVDIAMNQEICNKRVKVLPVMFRRCELPWFLEGKLYADFTEPKNYKKSLDKVLKRLGVKDLKFTKQISIYQQAESLLFPLVKTSEKILESIREIPEYTKPEWEFDGKYWRPHPYVKLAAEYGRLNEQYLTIRGQLLELLILSPEQLSNILAIDLIYKEILTERREKITRISLLDTEANPRYRTRWEGEMQESTKRLHRLHLEYLKLVKQIKMELTGEKLWSIESIFEFESNLDYIFMYAYHI